MNDNNKIHYKVDDEPQSTTEEVLTPVQIMKNAGIDPNEHYLVEVDTPSKISFKGKPDESIKMREGMIFISHFSGIKPVS